MHVFAQIFYFRTGRDAFSQQNWTQFMYFFLIAVSCTPVAVMCFLPNFAPRWIWQAFMCSHLCTYSHRYSIFVQAVTHSHKTIERSLSIFPIALCCTPVAATCFLPNFAPWRIWQAFMCSHLCTYSHRYSIFVQAVTHSHKTIERSLSIFPIALCYTPVAATCFLPNFAPWRIWQAFMCSHLCTYSHRYFFFVQAVTHSHKKLNVVYFFSW